MRYQTTVGSLECNFLTCILISWPQSRVSEVQGIAIMGSWSVMSVPRKSMMAHTLKLDMREFGFSHYEVLLKAVVFLSPVRN